MKCFISSCASDFPKDKYVDGTENESLSLHRFPKELERRIAWLQSIANAENKAYVVDEINLNAHRVCSKHFLDADFYVLHKKRQLKKTAIPVVFGSNQARDGDFGTELLSCDEIRVPDVKVTPNVGESSEDKKLKRKRTLRYAGDIKNKEITPEEAIIILPKVQSKLLQSRRAIKLLRNENKRMRNKLNSMQEHLNNIASKSFLSDESNFASQQYSSNQDVFEELHSRTKSHPCSESMRNFATTLHFHSPKAYSYMRSVFNDTLPHPRTLVRWYKSLDGKPGIKKETLDVTADQVKTAVEETAYRNSE
ncbi:uncharacterized protein LOC129763003 [Toxorhynchites rutilus septentrionalis]|uniref:uncharacterized protein LOC129763003 n=1 Tax=Toxorhynchites rutilus septentrionalis TaxID=329112 RepID=UPI002479B0CA|nr:uncharacterized protein LOC129763003 [Toxorhynchites rutilus septentrionalis]